ncbi:B-cell receptor CD22-like isoform X1 [Pelodiscus sinensis]|uniref:B-cell receptor CD22-like isoform X1 n=1 Tax=Pelodiscus sinensis TaxID=13735 RepID=UPI003F6D97D1
MWGPGAGQTPPCTRRSLGILLALFCQALHYSDVSASWGSSLPKTIRALKGSCVVIPCSFTYPGSRESLERPFRVTWYQYRSRGYPEIYSSKGPASVLPEYQARTELLGDPETGNCTLSLSPVRSEDAMSYYVWFNPDSVSHRFYDVTVQLEVADTPDPLVLSDPGVLIEGNKTTITCSIRHTCPLTPPTLAWTPVRGKAVSSHQQLAGGSWLVESELSYTPSPEDHGRHLQCTATFPNRQQARSELHLQVKSLRYSDVSASWGSSLPKTIRALKGSCVVIPCSFTYPGSRESLERPFRVTWYQYRSRGYPEIYSSKGSASVLPEFQARTELLGDPETGNCTLSLSPVQSEDAMSYYVWINPDSVSHRFYDVTVQLEVADTPDPLVLSDPGVLIEGNKTTINCSIRHTCPLTPPSLAWTPVRGKAVSSHQQLAGGSWRVESELSYTPSPEDHGRHLQCTATFPNRQQARSGLHLQVKSLCYSDVSASWGSSLPKTIRALKGSCVVIPCSFTYPGSRESLERPFRVTWYQYQSRGYPEIYSSKGPASVLPEYQARTELLGDPETGNCTLSLSPVRSEDAMSYYVWINPDSVRHRFYDVTVQLEVADRPQGTTVTVLGPAQLKEGDSVTLRCTSQSNPPATGYRWFQGTRRVPLRGLDRGSELRVPAVRRQSGPYRCAAENEIGLGEDSPAVHLDVQYAPELLPGGNCTVWGSRSGGAATCYCAAEGNPPPCLQWRLPNRTLPGDFEGPELRATSWVRGPAVSGELQGPAGALANVSCAAANAHGQSQAELPLVPADAPELLPGGNCTVRGSGPGGAATCYCAAEGNPPPRLQWRLPNRTLPGDFEGPELRATSWVRGPAVSGELQGPAGALTNVSCAAANAHGQSQAELPLVSADTGDLPDTPAGNNNLLFILSGGVIGGVLLLSVLAIVVCKVARTRKDGKEGPSRHNNGGNGEQQPSPKGGKPTKVKKEEQFNLYKPRTGGEPQVLDTADYEAIEQEKNCENLAAGGDEVYENMDYLKPHLLSDQEIVYSNV